MPPLVVESTSLETYVFTVTTTDDPSGAPPEFSLTPESLGVPATDPGTWEQGSWGGTWNSTRGTIEAITPQIGRAPAALETTEGIVYRLWVRWTAGADQPVRNLGRVYTK